MFLKYNWFSIFWTVVIFVGHAIPGNELPKPYWDIFQFDQLVHIGLFAVWAFALGNGFHKQTKYYLLKIRYLWVIIILSLLYALTLETLQNNIFANREFSFNDLISDLIGTVIGLGLLNALYGRLLKLT